MCVGCYTAGDKVLSDEPTVAIVDDMGSFIGGERSMIVNMSIESVGEATGQLAASIVAFNVALGANRKCKPLVSASPGILRDAAERPAAERGHA